MWKTREKEINNHNKKEFWNVGNCDQGGKPYHAHDITIISFLFLLRGCCNQLQGTAIEPWGSHLYPWQHLISAARGKNSWGITKGEEMIGAKWRIENERSLFFQVLQLGAKIQDVTLPIGSPINPKRTSHLFIVFDENKLIFYKTFFVWASAWKWPHFQNKYCFIAEPKSNAKKMIIKLIPAKAQCTVIRWKQKVVFCVSEKRKFKQKN